MIDPLKVLWHVTQYRIILSYYPDQLLHQLNPSHFRPSSISISPENIKIIGFMTFSVGKEMELQRETESWFHLVLSKILLSNSSFKTIQNIGLT